MSATSPAAPGRHRATPGRTATPRPSWRGFFETALGIVGAIALFLGVFARFAGEGQSIGFFGVWSIPAEDVSDAWTFTLLAGGSLLLGAAFALAALRRSHVEAPVTTTTWVYAVLAGLGLAAAVTFGVLWALA